MTLAAYPPHVSEPEFFSTRVRMVGTGAAAPTKILGSNVTITRVGAGQYRLTFGKNPGNFAGIVGPSIQATTPGDVKGVDLVFGAWTAATASAAARIDLFMYDGGVAHDLAALEWIAFDVSFKRTKV